MPKSAMPLAPFRLSAFCVDLRMGFRIAHLSVKVAFAGLQQARSQRISLQPCVDLRTCAFIPRPSRAIVQGLEAKGHVGIALAGAPGKNPVNTACHARL
jgi:hypothetical protein